MIGSMRLAALAPQLEGELHGADRAFAEVCTDTRSLRPGDLFVALRGANFDGNDFIAEAARRGAAGAVVSRLAKQDLPQLHVADTGQALARLARINREHCSAKVLAITGSQGKTTVKEMLHAIVSRQGESLATRANLNNTIGVPLTLLRIKKSHRFAVIEMGANRAGEIARSVAAARPDIALITNASVNHAEGFGGLEGVVRAKGEIIDGLKPDGVLLLNAADPRVGDWRRRGADFRQVLFSLHERPGESGYCAAGIELNNAGQPSFELVSPRGMVRVGLRLLGEHNVANAVAAAAAAFEAGAGAEAVKQGLEAVEPVPGRLCPQAGPGGLRIIDDSYNAAPGSFRAAIELLARLPGESLLIAGDMLELGPGTEAMHREIGSYAAARGIGQLWATGELCRHMVKGFGHAGRHFAARQQLLEALDEVAAADRVVLVKGSRGARMDEVTAILQKGGTD